MPEIMCNHAHCKLVFVLNNILLLTSHLFINVEGFSFMYHGSPCKAAALFLWFDACKNTTCEDIRTLIFVNPQMMEIELSV